MLHNIRYNGVIEQIDCDYNTGRLDKNGFEIYEGDHFVCIRYGLKYILPLEFREGKSYLNHYGLLMYDTSELDVLKSKKEDPMYCKYRINNTPINRECDRGSSILDKNGDEIFENDFLLISNLDNVPRKIIFHEGYFYVENFLSGQHILLCLILNKYLEIKSRIGED